MIPETKNETAWPSRYDPREVEDRIYKAWLKADCFSPSPEGKKSYVIVIPPPNVTGILTLGHVLNNTLQDILIRWQRMKGKSALWLPGTDHAGIATQNVVEKDLSRKGIHRHDLGRQEFVKRVWEWKERYGGTIIEQLKKLGSSCDWSRQRFTLDEGLSRAVREVFVRLYRKKLIYRGPYLINWCPRCHTALSDEEVEHEEKEGSLWYIRYPLAEGDASLIVATTRPETMLGDTAVAVNPADERYRDLIGKNVRLPLTDRVIPVIADEFVDPAFGTGAVKVTPAHDPNDFLIGERHNLPQVVVMDTSAAMSAEAGEEFAGMDRFECREKLVGMLKDRGLLEKVEKHTHAVGHCYRCRTVIEPSLSVQWFVRMKPLAEPALKAVRDGKIKLYPGRWLKVYQHWMENIRDWCISRQLWWGHRIPAWYRGEETYVGIEPPEGEGWVQDEDVLDTWFSSWLWPFSTLGWPEKTEDLGKFYPTSTLVTGPDIIFFWVARMIMAGLEFPGEIPFREVYFTGIIRDTEGRKMSKSLGNSPDPLDVIREYGADALRFTIARLTPIGQDVYYSNKLCELGRNFANKIWNASRFVISRLEGEEIVPAGERPGLLSLDDKYILSKLQDTITRVERELKRYHFNEAALAVYDFFWHHFCDRYLEAVKFSKPGEPEDKKAVAAGVLELVLKKILALLHPIMPFLTEEIWRRMGEEKFLMLSGWPRREKRFVFPEAEAGGEFKFELIGAARNLRADYRIPPRQPVTFILKPSRSEEVKSLREEAESMAFLIKSCRVEVNPDYQPPRTVPSIRAAGCEIYLPLEGVVDLEQERARFQKQYDRVHLEFQKTEKRLKNPDFLAKAPEEVRAKNRKKAEALQEEAARLKNILSQL